ncbi:MAG: transketolase [Brevinematales bacterium]|nr:transketolase [Brevinematales bacterium]
MDEQKRKEFEKELTTLRRDILLMLYEAKSGHPGGSLSAIDVIAYLFLNVMKYDPANPMWDERDRFILSKGHAAPALYVILARVGYFSPKLLKTLRKLGSPLQGHPDSRKLPGVESSTGSLGQGISIAGGIALAGKTDNKPYNVYTMLGDGEIQEGQVWEAMMAAAQFKLDNFCVIIDNNGLQIDGPVSLVMNVDPIADKLRAFNFATMEIDGHNPDEIEKAMEFFKSNKGKGVPTGIVSHTIKGKCISFMENKASWHGVAPTLEELEKALDELGCIESLEDWLSEGIAWER